MLEPVEDVDAAVGVHTRVATIRIDRGSEISRARVSQRLGMRVTRAALVLLGALLTALLPALAGARAAPDGSAAARRVTLGCRNSVFGGLGNGWRRASRGAIIAGPLAWPLLEYIASDSGKPFPHPSSYAARGDLAPSVKALVVINPGRTVRLSVQAGERARLSLDYDYVQGGTPDGYFKVAAGAAAVTFVPCAQQTQFAGGFIVAGRQCARLDIYVGHSAKPILSAIPFGVPTRRCRPS